MDNATHEMCRTLVQYERRTIGDVLREQADRLPKKPFMTFIPTDRVYTYREVEETAARLAERLAGSGLEKGDRVALFMNNSPEMIILMFGSAMAGAVAAPINTAAKGQLLHYYLELSKPSVVFVDAKYYDAVAAPAGELGIRVVSVTADGGMAPDGAETLAALMASDKTSPLPEVHYSDIAMLLFTSGTTGKSKAIMVPHSQAIFWGGDGAYHGEFIEEDVEYVCLPLFHGNAVLNGTYGALAAGTSIILTNRFSVSGFLHEVRTYAVTRVVLIGAMINFLWTQEPGPGDRDHKLRLVAFAPAPSFATDFLKRFGVRAYAGFGLTDFALATGLEPTTDPQKIKSVGRARNGITIKIVDDDDVELPQGEVGEIVLRSDNAWGTSLGYFRNPEATIAANRNQWFHTGDNGYLDADGYLYFKDRKKDAIRRRGENISAFEVEEIIHMHPGVHQAAVYALASEYGEDEVAATIQLRNGALVTFEDVVRHCVENMSYFMVPRYVEFVDELPKTPSAKVEKYKLRQRAMVDRSHLWDREAAGITVQRG